MEEIRLAPGDLLVIFSDGVTEAAHNKEEYGEVRLIRELQACRDLQVSEIVRAIFASVQEFSAGVQSDDLTLPNPRLLIALHSPYLCLKPDCAWSSLYPFLQDAGTHFLKVGMFFDV